MLTDLKPRNWGEEGRGESSGGNEKKEEETVAEEEEEAHEREENCGRDSVEPQTSIPLPTHK